MARKLAIFSHTTDSSDLLYVTANVSCFFVSVPLQGTTNESDDSTVPACGAMKRELWLICTSEQTLNSTRLVIVARNCRKMPQPAVTGPLGNGSLCDLANDRLLASDHTWRPCSIPHFKPSPPPTKATFSGAWSVISGWACARVMQHGERLENCNMERRA